MYHLYVLRSLRDGKLYTGVTNDLDRRLREHRAGKTRSLRSRLPVTLAYVETFTTKREALARERYFKTPEGGLLKQQLVAQSQRQEHIANAEGWPSG